MTALRRCRLSEQLRAEVSHGSSRLVQIGFPGVDAERFALLAAPLSSRPTAPVSPQKHDSSRAWTACSSSCSVPPGPWRRHRDQQARSPHRRLARGASGCARASCVVSGDTLSERNTSPCCTPASRAACSMGMLSVSPHRRLARGAWLRTRFVCVVSGGDTLSERKPHPLPMLHARRSSPAQPRNVCGLRGRCATRRAGGARAAGMRALVAAYGYLRADEDWRAWGGDGSIERPADLLDWLDREQSA